MKSILNYTTILAIITSFCSCNKEKQALNRLDGTYMFYHYEVDFYDNTGIKIDSSWNRNLEGEIKLEQEKDDLPEVHKCTYSLADIPKGWFNNNVTTQTPKWQTDISGKTINFYKYIYSGNIVIGVNQAQYTVSKKSRKLVLSYVQTRLDGTVSFQERLYLKKK